MNEAIVAGVCAIVSVLMIVKADYLAERIHREAGPHPRPLRWVERTLYRAWFIRSMGVVFLIFVVVTLATKE